jgi:hypothetical protein
LTFDFSMIADGITSAAVSVSIKTGIDESASDLLLGSAVIDPASLRVQQWLDGGVSGVTYYVRADVVASGGEFACVAVVPVLDATQR